MLTAPHHANGADERPALTHRPEATASNAKETS